jgi:hypothetical protein
MELNLNQQASRGDAGVLACTLATNATKFKSAGGDACAHSSPPSKKTFDVVPGCVYNHLVIKLIGYTR